MLSIRRWRLILVTLASAVAVVSACSGHKSTPSIPSSPSSGTATDTNVRFKDCAKQCTGTLDGAAYAIRLPKQWNGTLLLWSHGYREAAPWPPDFAPVVTTPQVSPTDPDGSGSDAVSRQLLSQGYALAGSAYKSNGWAVADGVKADEDLHAKFVDVVGSPRRTYVWGGSLGGLITEVVSERNPKWVDGAAPICGVLGGPNLNLDLALDVGYAIKALIDPQLKLTGYTSAADAAQNWEHAAAAVQKAAADTSGGGTAKALLVAALADSPTKTKTYDGHDVVSQVKARVESTLTALAYGTSGRYEIERRVGGNPSDNTKADYAARIDSTERGLIAQVGGNASALLATLSAGQRVSSNSAARDAFEKLGDTSGDLSAPTVTMHTENDPLVLVQNERVFAGRVQSHSDTGDLVQLYIAPPATYDESKGAPYGAGHCNFSDQQLVGVVSVLDTWVRKGIHPSPAGVVGQLGDGIDPAYVPGAWPDAAAK